MNLMGIMYLNTPAGNSEASSTPRNCWNTMSAQVSAGAALCFHREFIGKCYSFSLTNCVRKKLKITALDSLLIL